MLHTLCMYVCMYVCMLMNDVLYYRGQLKVRDRVRVKLDFRMMMKVEHQLII